MNQTNTNKQKIYQDYLTTDMSETDLIALLDVAQLKNAKKDGAIYTPSHIVSLMITITKPQPNQTIIEPSVGHGVFLFGLLKYMQHTHHLENETLLSWFLNYITAIDISENTILELKETIQLYFKKHFNIHVQTEQLTNIICGDSLSDMIINNYDISIGNPPYIRTKNLDEITLKNLRKSFNSCSKGNIDIYYAFLEKFNHISKEMCFITPNGFLTNISGKTIKHILKNKITHLLDFKSVLIFKDARTYTCIIKTNQHTNTELLYSNHIEKEFYTVKTAQLLDEKQTNTSNIKILSGIATLCDSVFLIKKNNQKMYATHENSLFEIEDTIVAPYLKITKQKNNDFTNINYMIYPYDINNKIIPEDIMKTHYPKTYEYLLKSKSKLLSRDKGKTDKYESWYAYGRKQGLHKITSNEIIAIPQMIGGECIPIKLNIEQLKSNFNHIVFTSGFIIEKTNDHLDIINQFLTKSFINYSINHGKAWPGKTTPYYSLTSKQISHFNQ